MDDWLESMNLYVSNIEELYKNTIIGHLGNSGKAFLSLNIVHFLRICAVGEEKQSLLTVL